MGILINSDDFVGVFELSQGTYQDDDIDAYIDQREKDILVNLLGVELFDLFEADLVAQVPATPIYQTIYNPFQFDDDSCVRLSDGMKKMLLGLIYFYYVRDDSSVNTAMGNRVNDAENSRESNSSERGLVQRYNKAIDTYQSIQWYICDFKTDYPTYNGQHKSHTSGI
jgi:hypothetical protein